MSHKLFGDLFGESGFETAADVYRSEFPVLALVVGSEFFALNLEIGLLRVSLRVNRNVFAGGH
jgi:hypothetical protein